MSSTTNVIKRKHPVPFVAGCVVTVDQMWAIARTVVSDRVIAREYYGNPLCALNDEIERQNQSSIVFPFKIGNPITVYFLYVTYVIPSFDGVHPYATIGKEALEPFWEVYGHLKEFKSKRLGTYCMRWPESKIEPRWLLPEMWDTVNVLKAQRKARRKVTRTESDMAVEDPATKSGPHRAEMAHQTQ